MSDIVERLHAHAGQLDWTGAETAAREREAAAEIERLQTPNEYAFTELTTARAEIASLQAWSEKLAADRMQDRADNERLRAVLQDIADMRYDNTSAAAIARAALEPKP